MNVETKEVCEPVDCCQNQGDSFKKGLEDLINVHCKENDSDTPDFILARYVLGCLENYAKITRQRDKWHGHKPWESREKVAN